ncbi:MAG: acylphosphatase [Nocardioidaceae bacterium]
MTTSDVIAREVVVHGIVQGVFFRSSCQQKAQRADVSGWARNESDGTVRAHFEGPRLEVESMVAWCQRGPRHAMVDRVDVTEREPSGLRGFDLG